MAIIFPDSPSDEQIFYVPDSDLVLQYDSPTNSWNIVGPDNLATIDYVDQTVATDATKTYRNSSLHRETNVLGVDTQKVVTGSVTCTNSATSSFSGNLKYAPDGKPLGPNEYNSAEYLIETKETIPEWHDCVAGALPRGTFTYVGHDLETSEFSAEFRYVLAFSMSKLDADNTPSKLGPVIPGDKLELYLDTSQRSATSDVKFAIYEVYEVYEGDTNVTLSVIFRDSNTPTQNITDGFSYSLFSYGSALEKTGGTLSGDLHVVNDSQTTFEVYKNKDDIGSNNPYNLVFKVNTTDNEITVNSQYNENLALPALDYQRDLDPQAVATVGFVNNRLGLPEDVRYRSDDGPYVQTRGGTIEYIDILNDGLGGTQNLVVRGIMDDPSASNQIILASLNNTQNAFKTEIRYYGPQKNSNELCTIGYAEGIVEDAKPNLSIYLQKDGGNSITGQLRLRDKNTNGYTTNIQDYDDLAIPCAAAVKGISLATVHKGTTNIKGALFESSGALYYNTY